MEFYRMLSENYSEIFPLSEAAVKMAEDITPCGGRVLDVGSAKGELVRRLVSDGYDAVGLEYVPELIGYPQKTIEGDMHSLPFSDDSFDSVICMGNTLVHSTDPNSVIAEFARVLKKGGKLLVQILNYDRIMLTKPEGLPLIETENIKFERKYEYFEDHILFKGKIISNTGEQSSDVNIYPIASLFITSFLTDNNLRLNKFYGGFDKSAYERKNSYSLVVTAEKM
jgi:SAM-dependent methyltransferase